MRSNRINNERDFGFYGNDAMHTHWHAIYFVRFDRSIHSFRVCMKKSLEIRETIQFIRVSCVHRSSGNNLMLNLVRRRIPNRS